MSSFPDDQGKYRIMRFRGLSEAGICHFANASHESRHKHKRSLRMPLEKPGSIKSECAGHNDALVVANAAAIYLPRGFLPLDRSALVLSHSHFR
jgi:hypothetical protein